MVDRDGRTQDGFLRTHDIYNLRLGADLVVLSACRTALGQETREEALVGLVRGFMLRRRPRVVASLWDVGDEPTVNLMQRFYERLIRDQMPPAAALRDALVWSRHSRCSAPYYWAVFKREWR
jgi:CHAT domain-containing protein